MTGKTTAIDSIGMAALLLVAQAAGARDAPPSHSARVPDEPATDSCESRSGWKQSYDAGYVDPGGRYAGGSEIMHLVPHGGKLFAANGYWMDPRWSNRPYPRRRSTQVLRLDAPQAEWRVDLDTTPPGTEGPRYMKGNILKSVTFTRDGSGRLLPEPKKLLILAAGSHPGGDRGLVSCWARDDRTGRWAHQVVLRGSRSGGSRWVPRDMQVYRDRVTGGERLFLLLGNPGIISGVYDHTVPTGIRWDDDVEFPATGSLPIRPLGMVEANGSLLLSAGSVIYRRVDGPRPRYVEVFDMADADNGGSNVNADLGGIRGMTTIPNPDGPSESILFTWIPRGRAAGQIIRLDPEGVGDGIVDRYARHVEANLRDLMQEALGVEVLGVLGGYNAFCPVEDPATGQTLHLIGFQGRLAERDQWLWKPSRYYAGAMYAVRHPDARYTVHQVNGPYRPGKPALVAPRTFAYSPFGQQRLFVGGHDANFKPSDATAWVYRAPLDAALGRSHPVTPTALPQHPARRETQILKSETQNLIDRLVRST